MCFVYRISWNAIILRSLEAGAICECPIYRGSGVLSMDGSLFLQGFTALPRSLSR
ncbi:MAG: hypothetical protein RQ885_09170 [Desulfurococcales archaeon]|nr:hypothetical protein [Desulfurococcales archaeon]